MARFNFDRLLLTKVRRRRFLIGTGALTGLAVASQWHKVIAQPSSPTMHLSSVLLLEIHYQTA